MSKRVTVEDLNTGDVETQEIENAYLLITDGRMELDKGKSWGNGSVALWLKLRPKPKLDRIEGALLSSSEFRDLLDFAQTLPPGPERHLAERHLFASHETLRKLAGYPKDDS